MLTIRHEFLHTVIKGLSSSSFLPKYTEFSDSPLLFFLPWSPAIINKYKDFLQDFCAQNKLTRYIR